MRRRARRSDSGFSLIESVVALSLGVAILLVVGMELVTAMHASLLSRQNSQAADLLMQQVENARSTPYAKLAMSDTDLGADSRINTAASPVTVPVGTGGLAEQIYAVSGGTIAPHVSTVTRSTGTYTLKRYVTTPAGCACRRFSALATWKLDGVTHRRWASTVVAQSTHGSLVSWSWSLPFGNAKSGTRGAQAALPALLLNSGQRGQWQLTASVLNSSGSVQGWTAVWYVDANGDGTWQQASETTRLDSVTAGTGLTGTVESGATSRPLAVLSVPSGATAGTYTVKLVATPVGVTGSAKTVTYTVAVS